MVDILNHVLPPTEQCRVVAGPHMAKGHTVEICKMVKTVDSTPAYYINHCAKFFIKYLVPYKRYLK